MLLCLIQGRKIDFRDFSIEVFKKKGVNYISHLFLYNVLLINLLLLIIRATKICSDILDCPIERHKGFSQVNSESIVFHYYIN